MIESRKDERINIDLDIYSKLCKRGNIYLTLPFLSEVLSDQSNLREYDTSDDLSNVLWCEQVLLINNDLQ